MIADWKEDLLIENRDLTQRLIKLTNYMESDSFASLDELNRSYIEIQKSAMEQYKNILQKRVDLNVTTEEVAEYSRTLEPTE